MKPIHTITIPFHACIDDYTSALFTLRMRYSLPSIPGMHEPSDGGECELMSAEVQSVTAKINGRHLPAEVRESDKPAINSWLKCKYRMSDEWRSEIDAEMWQAVMEPHIQ